MNYKKLGKILGKIMILEAILMLAPLAVSFIYRESLRHVLAFVVPIALLALFGILLQLPRQTKNTLYQKEGFALTALVWIIMTLFGALPFVINREIPNYVNACFEIMSGFTTTGASIVEDITALSHSTLFWRSFSHWVGGMGVLVFIMVFLPLSGGQNMHIMKAESPGPSVSKLVPRVKDTALILYAIYIALTALQFVALLIAGNSVFDSANLAIATAGTGGFGFKNDSLASFSAATQVIVAVFMILFSINFNSYFFILRKNFKDAFSTEVKIFLGIVIAATAIISFNIFGMAGAETVGDSVRHSFFTVSSIISTSGFSTLDFDRWPELSKTILILIMFTGGCAGATCGGIKLSRIILMFKGMTRELSQLTHPKQIKKITLDSRPVDREVVRSVNAYIICYVATFMISVLLLSINNFDFTTNFTATTATINNIGPGLNLVGPTQNYAFFSPFSKLVLIFNMLAGRLELFPVLVLFARSTWKK